MSGKRIVIITAPSGAGKTSITKCLLGEFPVLAFSISAATRPPRASEKHGLHYYFISEEAFKQHIQEDDFVEWEMVYEGKYYGTLRSELERIWDSGRIPVLDIDVQGAIHVKQQYPGQCLTMFIEAPSIETLRERLESRGTESEESMQVRLGKAAYEMSFKDAFDVVVVNEDLGEACRQASLEMAKFLNAG